MSLNRCCGRLNYLSERSLSVRNLVNTWSCSSSSLESWVFGSLAHMSCMSCLASLTYISPPRENKILQQHYTDISLHQKINPISILCRKMSWDFLTQALMFRHRLIVFLKLTIFCSWLMRGKFQIFSHDPPPPRSSVHFWTTAWNRQHLEGIVVVLQFVANPRQKHGGRNPISSSWN